MITIDASKDLEIFAQYIAPQLHIKIRFVGEEPYDATTRQYNEAMKKILPQYGIQLVEIPRKTVRDQAISAAKVRALLEVGDEEALKELLPETTYYYLKDAYHI